jgi:putative tricarboxylic transport membrane protein
MTSRFGTNQAAALGVGAVAVAAFAATWGFDPVPEGLPGLGAVEFPRLICLVMAAMAVALFLQPSGPRDPEVAPPIRGDAIAIFAACLAAVPLMAVIGMLGTIAAFLAVAGWLWGERRWPLLAGVSLGMTLVIWMVFVKVFRLTLPGGMLFGG